MTSFESAEPRSLNVAVRLLRTRMDGVVNETGLPPSNPRETLDSARGFGADVVAVTHYWRIGPLLATTCAEVADVDTLDDQDFLDRLAAAFQAVGPPPASPPPPRDVLPTSASHIDHHFCLVAKHLDAVQDILDSESAFLDSRAYARTADTCDAGAELLADLAKGIRERGLHEDPGDPSNAVN